jgi:hypothetical protein
LASSSALVASHHSQFFSRWFGVAVVAHVVGNAGQPDIPSFVGVINLVLGLSGVLLIFRPLRPLLVVSAAMVAVSVVAEMPVTGNHWLLAALGGLAIVIAGGTFDKFAPALRLIFLVFYFCAAFAKLNSAFFDPSVSCAVFFTNQFLNSWMLPTVSAASFGARSVVWAAAIIELSIVPLLLIRRTRNLGVLLAMGFHGLISLDLNQHFYDFTAVLIGYLILFLPDTVPRRLEAFLGRVQSRAMPLAMGLVLSFLVVVASLPTMQGSQLILQTAPFILWSPIWLGLFGSFLLDNSPGALLKFRTGTALGLIVALTVANGLTPYAEIKTGFGFNMYSNLLTAAGESNHLVIRKTWPLRNGYQDPVKILSTDDPGLDLYREHRYLIAFPEFRHYLFGRSVAVTYERGSQITTVEDTSRPAPLGQRRQWWSRFLPLRAIDEERPPRCQDVFLPAL